jgi:predicted N-acetyltransferase YhbS
VNLRIRALEPEDQEALHQIEAEYCAQVGVEPLVGAGSLGFFARSGHSFVAEDPQRVRGAVLAQAVWDGVRPTVWLLRLFALDAAAQQALLAALVKSAYDAAVYDLVAEVADADAGLVAQLQGDGWRQRPTQRFERRLGSRR